MTLRSLVDEFKRDDLKGDPWGTTMGWFFRVADCLYFRDVDIPDEWKFRPSPCGSQNEPDDFVVQVIEAEDNETLLRFGNLMHRFCDVLKKAGRDY
jgi:hypothetical protein